MDADDAGMMPVLDRMRCPVGASLYFLFLAAVAATSYSINRKGTLDYPQFSQESIWALAD